MTAFTTQAGLVRVTVEGSRLDAAAAPGLKNDLQANLPGKPERVLVDIGGVDFIDSTGLGVFVSLLKMMGSNGTLAIAGAQAAPRRLFQLTGMDRVFRLFDTVAEAEAALTAGATAAH